MNGETVKLIENFVTWQGEGPDSGRTMNLLRFKTCNLNCPWCDTSVRMRISSESHHLLSDIQETINQRRAGLLITGGEPTVERHFEDTTKLLNLLEYSIANVETNGYNLKKLLRSYRKEKNVKFIYSPKVFSKKDVEDAQDKTIEFMENPNVYFKLVWGGYDMKAYCEWLSYTIKGTQAEQKVWLMPEGASRKSLLINASSEVFDACERYKFNFSTRSHIIYGFI